MKHSPSVNSLQYLFQYFDSLFALCQEFSILLCLTKNDKVIIIFKKFQNSVSPKYQLFLAFLHYTSGVSPWISVFSMDVHFSTLLQ